MGGFSYAVVIGDSGWHEQEVFYNRTSILTGNQRVTKRESGLLVVETGTVLTTGDIESLEDEVREKIKPPTRSGWFGRKWQKGKSGIYQSTWSSYDTDEDQASDDFDDDGETVDEEDNGNTIETSIPQISKSKKQESSQKK